MDTFPFAPFGDVKISYVWNNKEVEFDNGTKQYVRKRVHAKKTYEFTIGGMRDYKSNFTAFLKFYNDHRGIENPFIFEYDGKKEKVRFVSAIVPKCYREYGRIVTFSCTVALEVDTPTTSYPEPSEDDVLPVPSGKTEETFDWNTGKVELGERTGFFQKRKWAARKISGEWCGLKPERDKMIRLFNSHCRIPLLYRNNGEELKVQFPDKLEITDHREAGQIIGYKCNLELDVVKNIKSAEEETGGGDDDDDGWI